LASFPVRAKPAPTTCGGLAAEQTSYPNEVCEMALAHVVGDKTEAAYRRGDLLKKRERLMADWAAYCGEVLSGAKIITINRHRAKR